MTCDTTVSLHIFPEDVIELYIGDTNCLSSAETDEGLMYTSI